MAETSEGRELLLSLCIIARNEEAFLPACLASVQGVVDEVVLVDTGSTDRTLELARAAGARIFERPWDDDFAAPRTLAARQARGTFVLVLDADERLATGAGPTLRGRLAQGGFDLGLVRLHNATTVDAAEADVLSGRARLGPSQALPRVLRRTPDLEWRGVVHESVAEWLLRGHRVRAPLDVDVVHLGAVPELRQQRAKRDRNIALLRRRIALEPDDLTPYGYLAFELMSADRHEEARAVMDQAWPLLARQPEWRCFARAAVARGILAVRRSDAEGALEAARVGEGRNGPHPDFDALRGMALEIAALHCDPGDPRQTSLLEEAEQAYLLAAERLSTGGPYELVAAVTPVSAQLHLGGVRYLRGRWPEALRAYSEALRLEPANQAARVGSAEVLVELGQAPRALELLQPALGPRPDAWLVAAMAAERLGALADARLFLTQAAARASGGYERLHRAQQHRALALRLGVTPSSEAP